MFISLLLPSLCLLALRGPRKGKISSARKGPSQSLKKQPAVTRGHILQPHYSGIYHSALYPGMSFYLYEYLNELLMILQVSL